MISARALLSWPVLQFFAFDIVWLICAWSSPRPSAALWSGAVAVPFMAASVWAASMDAKSDPAAFRLRTSGKILAAAAIGYAVDSGLFALGYFVLRTPEGNEVSANLAPLWLAFLWVGFATTLTGALSWLSSRPVLTLTLGAVAGPVSYLAGASFGAFAVKGPWLWLAIVWGPLLWILLRVTSGSRAPASSTAATEG
jgi:hypothetical protein